MTDEHLALLRRIEGLRLKAYLCQAGYPTQGYGHRVPSLGVPPITVARAEQLLKEDVAVAEEQALELAPNLGAFPRRLAALTDLCFNVGAGALKGTGTVAAFKREDWKDAAARFRKWNHYRDPKTGDLLVDRSLTARRETGARWIEEGP